MAGLQKVLLIEDNLQLQEIYSVILETEGYQVEIASNGPHGLQKSMMFSPDIIFLDIMMPGMNGLEVLKHLRERPEYNAQNCKIVLLTNLGHDERIEDAWRKHADGYVIKAEISPEELIDIIHSLENPAATPQELPAAYVPAPTGTAPGTGQPITGPTLTAVVQPAAEPSVTPNGNSEAVALRQQPSEGNLSVLPVAAVPEPAAETNTTDPTTAEVSSITPPQPTEAPQDTSDA